MLEDKRKYLEFVQNIITRQNSNSFNIKTITISFVIAIVTIYASVDITNRILLFLILPVVVFWYIDSIFVVQEKKYRELYNDVIYHKNKLKIFDLNIEKYTGKKFHIIFVMFSKTLLPYYISIIFCILIAYIIIK